MDKKLLLEKYIKVAVRKALAEQEEMQQRAEKSMYLVYRFPGLKKVIEDTMSPAFNRFVTDVSVISPKPTTFKVTLINEQEFTVKYLGNKNFSLKISGKKYNPLDIGEQERASQAISDLLELNYSLENKDEAIAASSKDADLKAALENPEAPLPPEAAQMPTEQPPTGNEEIPAPETPAPEIPTTGGETPAPPAEIPA
jgi:hypothetical protein